MTTRELAVSRVRGQALAECVRLARAGESITDDQACGLFRALTGARAVRLSDPVWTSGGAVVTARPTAKGRTRYTVQVSASPI